MDELKEKMGLTCIRIRGREDEAEEIFRDYPVILQKREKSRGKDETYGHRRLNLQIIIIPEGKTKISGRKVISK